MRSGRPRPDRGSGTVWTVALMAALWSVGVAVMVVGGVRSARCRTQTAADLAALAAASRASAGPAAACEAALVVVAETGGRLVRCTLHEAIAEVTVALRWRIEPFIMVRRGMVQIVITARAGPASAPAGAVRHVRAGDASTERDNSND